MERRLFFLLFFRLVAFVADLVLLGAIGAAFVRALLGRCYRLVTAGSFFLAFFAELLVFMRIDAALVVTFFALGFRLDATALTGNDGAGAHHEDKPKGQARQCFG